MPNVNGMQANMGLSDAYDYQEGMRTPTPAEASMRLSMAAAQQLQMSQKIMSNVPLGASQSLQQQFQRQSYNIQAQQTLNPYMANAVAGSQPGGSEQYLPSPITMTPPDSGVFRPPPARPAMAPFVPTFTPSRFNPIFSAQTPPPMFGSVYDQQVNQNDMRANERYAYGSQVPGALGYGAGIMAGAGAGAAIGRTFGGWGALAGGVVGGAAAGFSGFASGIQGLTNMSMLPSRQRHRMGAGLQNMTQNWVTTGADVGASGRGLGRDASLELARQIQDLGGDSDFQKRTGKMFNSQDLMQITRQGGAAGLFDMAQDIPRIRDKLKETTGTIKSFMELTNDPSVTSVIRQMGRMQQFGMNQQEMLSAAQGMRSFAKAAGTTIGGIQQIGGLPGAATFQGAGLTAGQGFQYGNFAAATANQMVASGALTTRQLALAGGKQGMAQRDMQMQASFATSPMFAASQAMYNDGDWTIDPSTAGRSDGAFGMVSGSLNALNQAANKGGIGALAMFQMKQKELADTTLASMSPMQALKQRMLTAMTTGQSLGMKGEQALAFGGMIHGDASSANQMVQMAKSPHFWESKRQAIRQRQLELGVEAQARNRAASSRFGGAAEAIGLQGVGSWGSATADWFGEQGEGIVNPAMQIGGGISKYVKENILGTDIITSQFATGIGGLKASALGGKTEDFIKHAERAGLRTDKYVPEELTRRSMHDSLQRKRGTGGIPIDQDLLLQYMKSNPGSYQGAAGTEFISNMLGMAIGVPEAGTYGAGAAIAAVLPAEEQARVAKKGLRDTAGMLEAFANAKKPIDRKTAYKQRLSLSKAMGGSETSGTAVEKGLGKKLEALIQERVISTEEGVWGGMAAGAAAGTAVVPFIGTAIGGVIGAIGGLITSKLGTGHLPTEGEIREATIETMMEQQKMSRKEAEAAYNKLPQAEKDGLRDRALRAAREQSSNKAAYDDIEGSSRKNLADQIETGVNWRAEVLRADETYQATERKLGIDPREDAIGDGVTYTDEERAVQDMAVKYGDDFGKMALILAQDRGTGDQEHIRRELDKMMLKERDTLSAKIASKDFGDDDARKLLQTIGTRAADEGVGLKSMSQFAARTRGIQQTTAYGSPEFVEKFGKYSPDLAAYLGAETDPETSGTDIAKLFDEDARAKMAKFGGKKGRQMAKLMEFAAYEGSDPEQQKRAVKSAALISKKAVMMAGTNKDGEVQQSKIKGDTEESVKLEKDLDAINAMAEAFKGFKPATETLQAGADALYEAMNKQHQIEILKGE